MGWDSSDGVILVDKMCLNGNLSPGMMKTVKRICKDSTESIKVILERLWLQMAKKAPESKIVSLQILGELFARSATVRALTLDNFRHISDNIFFCHKLTRAEAASVVKEGCRVLRDWHEKFGDVYPVLQTSFSFLKSQKVNFDSGSIERPESPSAIPAIADRLQTWVTDAISETESSVRELESLIEIILPFAVRGENKEVDERLRNAPNASTAPIVLQLDLKRTKIKRDETTREIERAIKPIITGLNKKIARFSAWIQGEFNWDDERLGEMIESRTRARRSVEKAAEIRFYDDSDDDEDDDFLEVPPDRAEAEIRYISDRLLNAEDGETTSSLAKAKSSPQKSKRPKIKLSDLAQYEQSAADEFVDTRNVLVNQLAERHGWTSTDAEISLDAAKALQGRFYSLDDFESENTCVGTSCRAQMPDGSLCKRRDLKKCPFHGPIVPRDAQGQPLEAPSATPQPSPKKSDKNSDKKLKRPSSTKERLSAKLFKRGGRK